MNGLIRHSQHRLSHTHIRILTIHASLHSPWPWRPFRQPYRQQYTSLVSRTFRVTDLSQPQSHSGNMGKFARFFPFLCSALTPSAQDHYLKKRKTANGAPRKKNQRPTEAHPRKSAVKDEELDFIRVKPAHQVPVVNFWAAVEPYFRPLTAEDRDFLLQKVCFHMLLYPRLTHSTVGRRQDTLSNTPTGHLLLAPLGRGRRLARGSSVADPTPSLPRRQGPDGR